MKHKKKILLVDDTDIVRDVVSGFLESEGYTIEIACDGIEAIEKLNEVSFDVVITDIKMPRMDGIGLLREIKKFHPDTEVILITGYDMPVSGAFLGTGAKALIHKSCEVETFISQMLKAIEREGEEL